MPILPRYFLRLFLPVFALCLSVSMGVLLMSHFLRLFNLAVMKGISPLWIMACFARLLPFIASVALPMSFLVALLITLGRLSEDGEATALRASGFSFFDMTWPFLAIALLLSAVLLMINHKTSPEGFHSFRNQYARAAQQIARVDLEPRAFIRMGPWKMFAREADPDTGKLGGVYLVRLEGKQQDMRIDARTGRLHLEKGRAMVLELEDGDIQLPNPDPEKFTSGHFRRYVVDVPLAGESEARTLDMQEMRSSLLRGLIRDPQTTPGHRAEYRVELAVRSAGAVSPFVFFWIAAPLGLQLGKGSRSTGFVLSLAILFGFYGVWAASIGLGRKDAKLSSAAPWAADVAGLGLGLFLTKRAAAR